ncbi:MAG: class I SAM-dependent methyltransferase [Eubacterium sp.]|nr:class I SAM-dependent methyltransferase [Eubacterium sp.]
MYLADRWKDYQVLDTSNGEKLERWGRFILLRPDPQVIWNTKRTAPEWKKLNGHYHRSNKGGGEWEFFDLPEEWRIKYQLPGVGINGSEFLTFNLKPFKFKHTGLFPEQAANWDWIFNTVQGEVKKGREIKVLNMFAYTGGATLAAAAAGAKVTHVDASKGMTNWAKENARSSGLEEAPIRWLVDDCMKFVEREIRRKNKYQAIIMDPPSYGRGPKGELWRLEDSIYELVQKTEQILADDAILFLINMYTTGLSPAVMDYIISSTIIKSHGGQVNAADIGLIVRDSGLVLPCGSSARWSSL